MESNQNKFSSQLINWLGLPLGLMVEFVRLHSLDFIDSGIMFARAE